MKNEFGVALDSNGYAPSIIQTRKTCSATHSVITALTATLWYGMKYFTARTGQKAKHLACGFWFARIATDGFTAKNSAGPRWKGWMLGCGLNSR